MSCFQFKFSSPLKASHKNEEGIKHNNSDTSFGRGCSQPVVSAVGYDYLLLFLLNVCKFVSTDSCIFFGKAIHSATACCMKYHLLSLVLYLVHMSFKTRVHGLEDRQLMPVHFFHIAKGFRDFQLVPLKLSLCHVEEQPLPSHLASTGATGYFLFCYVSLS